MPTYTGQFMATGNSLPRKSLGQHWLNDTYALNEIVKLAEISHSDTILEIGPGSGNLTKLLADKAKKVIAVELDGNLISNLESLNIRNLVIKNLDILNFNFQDLPPYKLVANIPYYLTGKILRLISEAKNRPRLAVLLLQQEIADKLVSLPGDMSVLALTCQFYWQIQKGPLVTADKFDPPPKVNSQIVKLSPIKPSLTTNEQKDYFRLIKIGFSSKRKTLLNNLTSGYRQDKDIVIKVLNLANIDPNRRAQTLSQQEWLVLHQEFKKITP
ncbi:MAG: 16S rRNA (adenine(1518)-N(6)/adenine(1519)-N(6))-dimethyltransferase RsmA [Candidatus Saccharimonadales bacterium]